MMRSRDGLAWTARWMVRFRGHDGRSGDFNAEGGNLEAGPDGGRTPERSQEPKGKRGPGENDAQGGQQPARARACREAGGDRGWSPRLRRPSLSLSLPRSGDGIKP